ncbi:MAG: DNA internalization-related competence protein ComEC/Rec2 [Oscillospiraceae bacterium]|nr:DNA internalization-related competence protein ComEC/Rec2 [Oscillospiraceae bacterium]
MRKLMWFTLGFGGACALTEYLMPTEIGLRLALCFLLLGAIGLWRRPQKLPWRAAVCLCLGLGVGLAWSSLFQTATLAPAKAVDGETREITVTLTDYPEATDYGASVTGNMRLSGRNYKILLYLYEKDETLQPGDQLTLQAKLRLTAEGGGSEPTYHRTKGIFLLGYARGQVKVQPAGKTPFRYYPAVLRKAVNTLLQTLFSADTAPFAKALLLGDKSGLGYAMRNEMSIAGLSHIVAVSGMHVTILFGMLQLLTGRRRRSALLGVPLLFLFAAVAGFTPSVTRAVIMLCLMLLAQTLRRDYDPATALSTAAFLLLAVNPMVIASISFQLSVGALTGIFLVSGRIHRFLVGESENFLRRALSSSVAASCGAMLFTAPLVAAYFGTVSLVGIFTNVLCFWAISACFCGIAVSCVLGAVWLPAGKLAAWCVGWLCRYILMVARAAAGFPFAAMYTQSIYTTLFLIAFYMLLGVFALQKCRKKKIFASCAALLLLLCTGLSWLEPTLDRMRVTAIDVGQGQCILLQTRDCNFLVDCGGSYGEEAGEMAARLLLSQGIFRLDGLILTHYDADHAGGIPQLLSRISCDAVYLPDTEDAMRERVVSAAEKSKLVFVTQDLIIDSKTAKLQIFAPVSEKSGNESCITVLFTAAKCDTLITGDLGTEEENRLLAQKNLPDLEILIVGHHGSATSTGYRLLKRLCPEIAVISVGANNRYGHPAGEVLQRLYEAGCEILRTDQDGTILIRR